MIHRNFLTAATLLATLLGTTGVASAEEMASPAASPATLGQHLKNHFQIAFYQQFYGPTLTGEPYYAMPSTEDFEDPSRKGTAPSQVELYNQLSFRYLLGESPYALDVQTRFSWLITRPEITSPLRQHLNWQSVRVGIRSGNWWSWGPFSLMGSINTDVPYSDNKTANNKLVFSPGFAGGLGFEPANTRFSAFVWLYPRAFFYAADLAGKNRLSLGATPQLLYKLTDTLSLTVAADFIWNSAYGQSFWDYTIDPINVYPGVEWDPSPNFGFMPYVNIMPFNHPKLANTSFGFWMYGRLF